MAPAEFFQKYAPFAIISQIRYGIPASVTLAQAALESGWGKYAVGNNFFGIKDQPNDEWTGPYTAADTSEYIGGNWIRIVSKFRKYDSPQGSFNDHASFLQNNKRYASLFKLAPTNYIDWSNGLKAAGYATAPNYGSTLINLIERYKLYQFDKQAETKKKIAIGAIVLTVVLVLAIIGSFFYKSK